MSGTADEEVIERGNPHESEDALSKEALSVCEDTEWELVYVEWVVKLKKLSKEAEANARREQIGSSVSETTTAATETTTAATETTTAATETTTAATETTTAATETTTAATETTTAATETTTAATETTTQDQKSQEDIDAPIPESPKAAFLEIRSILSQLNKELAPQQQTWTIRLNGDQMKKLNRITLLRAPFFAAPLTGSQAIDAWRPDLLTADDLKNKKTLRQARRRIRKLQKEEKAYNKALKKTRDQYASYLNDKNSTNKTLNEVYFLEQLNETLEWWTYINQSFTFMPEVSPLILNLCQKGNLQRLSAWQCVQLRDVNNRPIDVYTENWSASARSAAWYLASCWGYSNVAEKWLTENTKMSQWQARNMLSTLWSVWMIAWVIWIGYWLFTKEENGSRKFSFPSLWKLWAVIGIPMLLNYTSQATTWNSLLDNLARLWKTWEFPWSSSENLSTTEVAASQQAMWQFVLLWIPKRIIKKYWTFESGKMTKISVNGLTEYMEILEKDEQNQLSSEQKARVWAQRIALERISKNDSAKIALNNYIARLWITESSLTSDPDGTLNERLWDAASKYDKMINYAESRWLTIASDKQDKVLDTIFKEKELNDEVFDKLKEEWCFAPNPKDERYKEIVKLNISNEKKIKLYEAYKKLCDDGTKFGTIKLEVENNKIKIISWAKNHKILLNTDLTIDNLTNKWEEKIIFQSEEELLRMWLFINYMRDSFWEEPTNADNRKAPFVLSWGAKFWEDIQFKGPTESKLVLSSMVPFFSDMAKYFPTIEKDKNREFLVSYLNDLWAQEHPTL